MQISTQLGKDSICMGEAFESATGKSVMSTKSSNSFRKAQLRSDSVHTVADEFIVSYWAVKQVYDARQANAKKEMKQILVKVGSDTFAINVPIITNPDGAIKAGSEIVVLKQDVDEESDEPAPKRQKCKGHGKGKVKRT